MNQYSFKILNEQVSNADSFSEKTHEKVANNLFHIMETSDLAATIGLEGGWGSGKSTVVNLLKNKLSKNQDSTLVYLFDAWAHDGDPLRRIFLEELIESLDPNNTDNKLQSLKDAISGKKKRIEITTTKSASKLGGFLSLSALFVPVGAALLSAIDYNSVHWISYSKPIHLPLVSGLTLALAPLWTLFLWRLFSTDTEKSKINWILGKKSWDIFQSTSKEKYSQDITEDGERTSIEFERFFKEIMNHSVGKGKRFKRALLVIDNLDRVSADKAKSIWSILQTFFQYRNQNQISDSDWESKLWFLIPYDRDGLSKVWGETNFETNLRSSEHILENSPIPTFQANDKKTDPIANSFLEKCFQIVEEVPEPVFSTWIEYLKDQINHSFANWSEGEREVVIDTYRRFESSLDKSPTPRQIHAFINKVGILAMRWGGKVSIESISLYALARKHRSERQLRAVLLTPGLPDQYQSEEESDIKAELAGILFGVDKSKGIQLLLEPEIQASLANGKFERINELILEHGEAYWVVWESVRDRILPNGHTEEYRISATLAYCKGTKGYENRTTLDIIRLVNEWKSRGDRWELDRHSYVEAFQELKLALKDQSDTFIEWINEQTRKELNSLILNIDNKDFKPDTLKELRSIVLFLDESGAPIQSKRYPKLNKDNWIAWLRTLERLEISFPEILPDSESVIDLFNSLDSKINLFSDISTTLSVDTNPEYWPSLSENMISLFENSNHPIEHDEAYRLMIQCFLNSPSNIKDRIRTSLRDNYFIQNASEESVSAVPSMVCLYLITYKNEIFDDNLPHNVTSFLQSKPLHEELTSITSCLKDYNQTDFLWDLAKDSENIAVIDILRSFIREGITPIESTATIIDKYQWANEKEIKSVINGLQLNGGFNASKAEYLSDPLHYVDCLKVILDHGGNDGRKYIDDLLDQIDTNNWYRSFREQPLLHLLLKDKGNHAFKDAMKKLCLEEIEGGNLTLEFWHNFISFYEKTPDKEHVLTQILKSYFSTSEDLLDNKTFNILKGIINKGNLSEVPTRHITERVESWLSNQNWDRLDWLYELGPSIDLHVSESLQSRLKSLLDENPDIQALKRISQLYKLENSR